MTDVTVTLTAAEQSAAEMALENVFNLLPTRNAELVHEASALAKLHAAQPGAMPSVSGYMETREYLQGRIAMLEVDYANAMAEMKQNDAERDKLRGWLRCMLEATEGGDECNHCTTRDNLVLIWNMSHHHAAACPWRQAAEYIQSLEVEE